VVLGGSDERRATTFSLVIPSGARDLARKWLEQGEEGPSLCSR
jgi:hypothetical protein